jgi:hypothetical protein
MRKFGHWTPRYIVNRARTLYYEKTCPDHPWLTRTANEILNNLLRKTDVGFEWGSGRSTRWIARRIGHLVSVEHDSAWAAKVREWLRAESIHNVDYRLLPLEDKESGDAEYVKAIDSVADESLDFCLIDGVLRDYCAEKALAKIKLGGILVIDNINIYLPSDTVSPASRRFKDGPASPLSGPASALWGEVQQRLASWRFIWTSSGVTDTAFYFKPSH